MLTLANSSMTQEEEKVELLHTTGEAHELRTAAPRLILRHLSILSSSSPPPLLSGCWRRIYMMKQRNSKRHHL
jgi:hypothetical protein